MRNWFWILKWEDHKNSLEVEHQQLQDRLSQLEVMKILFDRLRIQLDPIMQLENKGAVW